VQRTLELHRGYQTQRHRQNGPVADVANDEAVLLQRLHVQCREVQGIHGEDSALPAAIANDELHYGDVVFRGWRSALYARGAGVAWEVVVLVDENFCELGDVCEEIDLDHKFYTCVVKVA
jgi:hypothetical protein